VILLLFQYERANLMQLEDCDVSTPKDPLYDEQLSDGNVHTRLTRLSRARQIGDIIDPRGIDDVTIRDGNLKASHLPMPVCLKPYTTCKHIVSCDIEALQVTFSLDHSKSLKKGVKQNLRRT
jgi:hypothetical protein